MLLWGVFRGYVSYRHQGRLAGQNRLPGMFFLMVLLFRFSWRDIGGIYIYDERENVHRLSKPGSLKWGVFWWWWESIRWSYRALHIRWLYIEAAGGMGHGLGYRGRFAWFVFLGAVWVCSWRGLCSMGSGSLIGLYIHYFSLIETAWLLWQSELVLCVRSSGFM